jgi:signal transduction histidine kinase
MNVATGIKSSDQYLKPSSNSCSSELQNYCQIQAKQLLSQPPIFWTRIVYYDFLLESHQETIKDAQVQSISSEALAYIRSEVWLQDYPKALTLNQLILSPLPLISSYICPLGYRNQKPEYILVLAHTPLSLELQQSVKQCAELVSKYLDLFLNCGQQQAEIQLLEQVLQRAGHQLRNPLALIGLCAENLCLGLPAGTWQEQATIIRETVQDLDKNLTELIYCGQGIKLRVVLQDLQTLITGSILRLQPWLQQKNLQVRYPDTSIVLAADPLQLKQVFDNLLSNAVHFSPDSGTILCSWQIFQGEVLIQISDQGPGLLPEELQQVFTPFYSRRPGGTGLGLSVAKKIVLDHHGNLWVQNLPEGGAQFSITLPRSIPS